jgi:hypothetical protein
MGMPEATMNKNREVQTADVEVWFAGQVRTVKPIPDLLQR